MKLVLAFMVFALVSVGSASGGERFACNMKALTTTERARYQELTQTLLAAVQEQSELPYGYAFRLPSASLVADAGWVSLEHRCCPFFTCQIEQTRDEGPVWLHVTGPEGVKAFIRDEFGLRG